MNARFKYKIIRTYVHTTQTDLGYCWHRELIRNMSLLASLAAITIIMKTTKILLDQGPQRNFEHISDSVLGGGGGTRHFLLLTL